MPADVTPEPDTLTEGRTLRERLDEMAPLSEDGMTRYARVAGDYLAELAAEAIAQLDAAATPPPREGGMSDDTLREAATVFLIAADNASLEALVDAEDGAEVPDWQERLWDAADVFRAAIAPSAEPPETADDD